MESLAHHDTRFVSDFPLLPPERRHSTHNNPTKRNLRFRYRYTFKLLRFKNNNITYIFKKNINCILDISYELIQRYLIFTFSGSWIRRLRTC